MNQPNATMIGALSKGDPFVRRHEGMANGYTAGASDQRASGLQADIAILSGIIDSLGDRIMAIQRAVAPVSNQPAGQNPDFDLPGASSEMSNAVLEGSRRLLIIRHLAEEILEGLRL